MVTFNLTNTILVIKKLTQTKITCKMILFNLQKEGSLDERLVWANVAHFELRKVKPKLTIIRRCLESLSMKNRFFIA